MRAAKPRQPLPAIASLPRHCHSPETRKPGLPSRDDCRNRSRHGCRGCGILRPDGCSASRWLTVTCSVALGRRFQRWREYRHCSKAGPCSVPHRSSEAIPNRRLHASLPAQQQSKQILQLQELSSVATFALQREQPNKRVPVRTLRNLPPPKTSPMSGCLCT